MIFSRNTIRTITGSMDGRRRLASLNVLLIIAVAICVNLWFLLVDKRPPWWDYAGYLTTSMRTYDALRSGSLEELLGTGAYAGVQWTTLGNSYRPPLVPLVALPFYALFGRYYTSAMLANTAFIVILVISSYGLTVRLTSSAIAGAAAAGITILLPGVISYARLFGLDFPLAALVAAGLYLTVASEGFTKRYPTILLGVVFALGMLIKWSYFVFVAPMVFFELLQERKRVNIRYIMFGVVVMILVVLPWYAYALVNGLGGKLLYWFWGTASVPYAPSTNLLDPSSLLYYPESFYTHLVGPFYSSGLIAAFVLAVAYGRKELLRACNNHLAKSLGLTFIISVLGFFALEPKGDRYLLPAIPGLVVLLLYSGWRTKVRSKHVGAIILVGLMVVGIGLSSLGVIQPSIGSQIGIYDNSAIRQYHLLYDNAYSPPQPFDWKLSQLLQFLSLMNRQANVGVLASHWIFNQDTLAYYAVLLGYQGLWFRDFRDDQVVPPFDNLNYYDFVLEKTGYYGGPALTTKLDTIIDGLKNPQNPFYANHSVIKTYELPDGSQLLVFVRNDSPSLSRSLGDVGNCSLSVARFTTTHRGPANVLSTGLHDNTRCVSHVASSAFYDAASIIR